MLYCLFVIIETDKKGRIQVIHLSVKMNGGSRMEEEQVKDRFKLLIIIKLPEKNVLRLNLFFNLLYF